MKVRSAIVFLSGLILGGIPGEISAQPSSPPGPTATPATHFEQSYNRVPYTGDPAQLRMIDQWGDFLNLESYDPLQDDEVGAFWNNGTEIILVGVTTISAYMEAHDFYIGLSIYGDDPSTHEEASDGLNNGAVIFYKVYNQSADQVYPAGDWNTFTNGLIQEKHDLPVDVPPSPTPIASPTPRYTPTPTPQGGGGPHTVTGKLFNSDHSIPADADISFSAFITLRPAEFLTQTSSGFGFETGYWQVNVGNFPTAWKVGEDLRVDFQNTSNAESGSLIYTLTYEDPDLAPDFYLSPVSTPTPTPHIPTRTPSATPLPTAHCPLPIIDFNGDGTSDIAVFRPPSGLWAIRGITRVYFGGLSDDPVPGDYDGDGTTEIGIFRASFGLWALRSVSRVYFGGLSDDPVPGDYDGDGTAETGIFRSASGLWAIRGVSRTYFGTTGDEPVSGYYDGDGTEDIALFRKSSGLWAVRGITRLYFGGDSDEIVPGDYDGDGIWEAGIFRPSSGLWAIRGVTRCYFGALADQPVPGDYSGTGIDAIGIFRAGSGLWAINGLTRAYYGSSGDIPVSR